jgi:exonuclease III
MPHRKGTEGGPTRLLVWNIRHGGGSRLRGIVAALARHDADVLVLCEYRRRTGAELRAMLAGLGYRHATATEPPPGRNGVLIAARRPLRERGPLSRRVEEPYRMLDVEVAGLRLSGVYLPNLLRKVPYWEAIVRSAARRRGAASLFVGDFNTTRHFIDEAGSVCLTSGYMDRIERAGFRDVYRDRHPEAREFSWYSHKGNGYRLDHAFGSAAVASRVARVGYSHAERLERLSDHSLLVLDIGHRPAGAIERFALIRSSRMPGTKEHRRGRPGSCGPPAARDQPGTTGVLCVGIFARTDRSMFRLARTSSYGVNASHCRSETSANLSVFHSSRNCSFVVPVFSM